MPSPGAAPFISLRKPAVLRLVGFQMIPTREAFNARTLLFAEAQRLRVPLTSFVVANVPPNVGGQPRGVAAPGCTG